MPISPRIVRPFFIRGRVDGVTRLISTGPTPLLGAMSFTVSIRHRNRAVDVLHIEGSTDSHSDSGEVQRSIRVYDALNGNLLLTIKGDDSSLAPDIPTLEGPPQPPGHSD